MDNNLLYLILGIIGSLLGAVLIQTNKKNQAQADLQNHETKSKDALLAKDQERISDDIKASEDSIEKVDEDTKNEKDAAKNASIADALNFWNKK